MARIAILFHEYRSDPAAAAIHYLANVWREAGHEVTYLFGTRRFVPADVLVVHVNLSVVPEAYLAFADRYPVVVNRYVTDIRKSTFSELQVGPADTWDGQVIVKSNLNYGGLPEKRIGRNWFEQHSALARRLAAAIERRWNRDHPFRNHADYRVVAHLSKVPRSWFGMSDVVVEKFVPEVEDGLYHVRMHLALGDRALSIRLGSNEPIIKMSNSVRMERAEPHPVVEEWRRRFRLDYGKFDYVMVDGDPVLLDVNKTTGSSPNRSGAMEDSHRYLAEGLYYYLRH